MSRQIASQQEAAVNATKILLASVFSAAAMGLVALALSSPSLAAKMFGGRAGGEVCRWMGGKWGSVRNECITRACYAAGDCGSWLHPAAWCRDLRKGDSIAEVYFRLGNPSKIEGNIYTWLDGKPDSLAFTALIENGFLTEVNCL
jgi:hypothetical protein